jgi:hypothetical protein
MECHALGTLVRERALSRRIDTKQKSSMPLSSGRFVCGFFFLFPFEFLRLLRQDFFLQLGYTSQWVVVIPITQLVRNHNRLWIESRSLSIILLVGQLATRASTTVAQLKGRKETSTPLARISMSDIGSHVVHSAGRLIQLVINAGDSLSVLYR